MRFIRVKSVLVVLSLIVGMVAGCAKAKQLSAAGTYVSEKIPNDYRELKSDGTFYLQQGPAGMTGTYEIEGDQITFKLASGSAHRCKIEGNTIVDPDGERFTKK